MTLLPYIDLAFLIGLFGIIVGTALGRLPGRWLLAGVPFALAALILTPLADTPAFAKAAQTGLVFPDRNRQTVVDAANVIPEAQERLLAERIGAYVKRTGHQLVVATVPTLQGLDVRDYGYRLGRSWALGRNGVDDGVILLLAPTERKIDIEVGYGLEPKLTDAVTSTIIHERVAPKLKAGDVAGALTDGADSIMQAASGTASDTIRAAPARVKKPETYSALQILCYILILAAPTALTMWLFRRSERRREASAKQRYAEIIATRSDRPQPIAHRTTLEIARARRTDDAGTGLGAAAVGESVTRNSDDSSSPYSAPYSPSIDTGSFDSGGGSFGGGGASSDY